MAIINAKKTGEDFDGLSKMGTSQPVSDGDYDMEIFSATIRRNQADTRTFLNLGLKHHGETRGPSVWYMVGLVGENSRGDAYPGTAYDAFLNAVGIDAEDISETTGLDVPELSASEEAEAVLLVNGDRVPLEGKVVKATLGQDTNRKGEAINAVKFTLKRADV